MHPIRPVNSATELSSGRSTPPAGSAHWSFFSKLSPSSKRRASFSKTKKIYLSASQNSLHDANISSLPHSRSGSTANHDVLLRRYSSHFGGQVTKSTSGVWRMPIQDEPGQDIAPGLYDLQCLSRRLVMEQKFQHGCIVLGRNGEEEAIMTGNTSSASVSKTCGAECDSPLAMTEGAQSLKTLTKANISVTDESQIERKLPDRDDAECETVEASDRQVVDPNEKEWFNLVRSQYVGEMEKMLVEEDIHIDRRDHFTGFTALHWACKFGNRDMLRLCVEHKANLNIRSHGGSSALHLASKAGHPSICTILLDIGANANLRDSVGKLPYHVADRKIPEIVKERMLKGVNSNATKVMTLMNIQVKKSSSVMSAGRLNMSLSKTMFEDEDGALKANSRRGTVSDWFKRKTSTHHIMG